MSNFTKHKQEIKPFGNKSNISTPSSSDDTFQKPDKHESKIRNVTICLTTYHEECTGKYSNSYDDIILICKCNCHDKFDNT